MLTLKGDIKSDKRKDEQIECYNVIKKLEINILQEKSMRNGIIKSFEIINEISNCGGHVFNISPRTGNFTFKTDFKNYLN